MDVRRFVVRKSSPSYIWAGSMRGTKKVAPVVRAGNDESKRGRKDESRLPALGERTLRFGARGGRVSHLQRRLHALGYEPGPEDGLYGYLTFAAVRDLQRDLHMAADGKADARVLKALADPRLADMHDPIIIAELHDAIGPAAAARVLQRNVRVLDAVSVANRVEQAAEGDDKDVKAGGVRPGPSSVPVGSDKEKVTWWRTLHTRADAGAGHYDTARLQRFLHRRTAREQFVRQALGPSDATENGLESPPLYLDLGGGGWGDAGHLLHVIRRVRRESARQGRHLAVSVPLDVDGRSGLLKTPDPAALAATADTIVLVPPAVVRPASRRRKGEAPASRPPTVAEVSRAVRDVVAEIPSWRCLLLLPLGALVLDLTTEDSPLPPTVLPYQQALALAYMNRTRPRWDELVGRPVFRCTYRGRPAEVWLENRYSVEQKLDLIPRRRLGGVYLFAVGLEDARMWTLVRERWDARR